MSSLKIDFGKKPYFNKNRFRIIPPDSYRDVGNVMTKEMKKTIKNSEKYSWGPDCLGWHLLNTPGLSVIQELMPPNTEEVKHKHLNAQQFFFILKGEATFDLEDEITMVRRNEGIHIQKNQLHQIKNESEFDLEFLVISQPHSHNDKVTQY